MSHVITSNGLHESVARYIPCVDQEMTPDIRQSHQPIHQNSCVSQCSVQENGLENQSGCTHDAQNEKGFVDADVVEGSLMMLSMNASA